MGQLGRFRYPEIGPFEAENIIDLIISTFGDRIDKEDREDLADLLGHEDASSGAFKQKLTALKRYGLLEGRGTLGTTELAEKLRSNGPDVYMEMLRQVRILYEGYEYFDGQPVEKPEWESFLERKTNIQEGVDDIPEASKLRSIYLEFIQKLGSESIQSSDKDFLDKEREFYYYVEKLDNPNTRELALDALMSKLRSKQLPDSEPLDVLLEFIRDNEYPNQLPEFYFLLLVICRNNDLDGLEEGKRAEVIDLLYDRMMYYSNPDQISQNKESLDHILDTLEQIEPDDLVLKWIDLLITSLKEGAESNNDDLRRFAHNDLAERLTNRDNPITREFYEHHCDETEDEIWNIISESKSDKLRNDSEIVLRRMGVF